jgi:hypothetical protein
MKRLLLALFVIAGCHLCAAAEPTALPFVSDYSMKIVIMPSKGTIKADVTMTVRNETSKSIQILPFLLYRLLDVSRVDDGKGLELEFYQRIDRFDDIRDLQVNQVSVRLRKPLAAGDSQKITFAYEGPIYGYPEVMAYVKDRISEEYSLIRPDAMAYPLLAELSSQSLMNSYGIEHPFTYDLKITVPDGYRVVCGGALTRTSKDSGNEIFEFRSKVPTWRVDIAAAKFVELSDRDNGISVFVLAEDQENAAAVLKAAVNAFSLFSEMFGPLKAGKGYTVIEIPDGWGSQASDFYLLQSAAAFKDLGRLGELYHEIGHSWNAKAKPGVQRSRWFDEAFASYFEAVAVREFEGDEAFQANMEALRKRFADRVDRDRKNFDTPIVGYGELELGANSYTKGAWSLYVLNELLGDDAFKGVIRAFLSEYRDKPADFADFRKVAEAVSKRDLDKYFAEWIYGTESSRLLADQVPIEKIVERY